MSDGLKELKDDDHMAEFLQIGYEYGAKIDLYVEHHDYNVMEWLDNERQYGCQNEIDVIDFEQPVDHEADHEGEHSDSCIIEFDKITNDPFLSKLCSNGRFSSHISDPIMKPDSDLNLDEVEDDDFEVDQKYKVQSAKTYPEHDPNQPWNEMKPVLGMRFENPGQLKHCLINYAVCNGFQLWFERNDYRSLLVYCGKNLPEGRCAGKKVKFKKSEIKSSCPFRLWASWMTSEESFQIKSLIPDHNCARNYNVGSLVTYKWIAKFYSKEIIENPSITYRALKTSIREKYMIDVSISQCKRGKLMALYDHEGGLIEHYGKLWDYRKALLTSNPGSTVVMDVDTSDDGKTYFNRFYVCFKGLADGWKDGCRRVIGIDGCFLKHASKGELLTAMGRDANNQMFPIAWAVVNVENTNNWNWFLALLHDDLSLLNGVNLTIISDGHKGLLDAVNTWLPMAEHRQCARHIYANFKKKWSGLHFQKLFWGAAASTVKRQFEEKMTSIKELDLEAYNYLVERDPNTWCRAFFEMDRCCSSFENGISESFNAAIMEARGKPIITMLEEIRVYLMIRVYNMKKTSTALEDTICPSIRKQLEALKKQQRFWVVCPSGFQEFEVRRLDEAYGVNLCSKKCDCRVWEQSGIPCVHAIAAYMHIKGDPTNGVSHWYSKLMWQNAYAYSIKPVPGSTMWEKTDDTPPLPPIVRKMPGRPKKKRKIHPSENDKAITRVGRQMTCKRCGEKGHNKATCRNPSNPPLPVKPRKFPNKGGINIKQPASHQSVQNESENLVDVRVEIESQASVGPSQTRSEDPIAFQARKRGIAGGAEPNKK